MHALRRLHGGLSGLQHGKVESGVARGKIAVAEAVMEGKLELDDPEVVDMLFNCLVCKSCMQSCPTKVNFDRIMLALRAAIVRKNGLPWLKKAIFAMLKQQGCSIRA